MHQLEIKKSAQKDLKKRTPSLKQKLIEKIRELGKNHRPVEAIKLADREEWLIRYADYRILYEIDDKAKIITIV